MRFEKLIVSKLGNSRVVKLPKFNEGDKIYILDEDMLEFIRGINLK